jgi:hypothetical protein
MQLTLPLIQETVPYVLEIQTPYIASTTVGRFEVSIVLNCPLGVFFHDEIAKCFCRNDFHIGLL